MSDFVFEENISRNEFDTLASGHGIKSHFLGSYAWGQVSATGNWTPVYTGVRKNGELVATALLLRKNLIAGYSYIYIPRGFTMDWSDHELLSFITKSIEDYCVRNRVIFFKIDPDIRFHTIDDRGNVIPGENNADLVLELGRLGYRHLPLTFFFDGEQPRFTFRISTAEDHETVRGRYDSVARTRLRRAAGNGVEVVKGTMEDMSEFYRLMTITEMRQNFFSHSKGFYENLYRIMSADDMVSLYLARVNIPELRRKLAAELDSLETERLKWTESASRRAAAKLKEIDKNIAARREQTNALDGRPDETVTISGAIVVRYKDKAWLMYAGNDMDYSKFFGYYAIVGRCIEDCCAGETEILDCFGTVGKPGEDKQLDGIHDFKRHWGGEYTEFIGEFEYIVNKPVYFAFKKLIPVRRALVNRRLRKQVKTNDA